VLERKSAVAIEAHPDDCPECRQGKHGNCAGWALDPDTDDFVTCACAAGGHA